MSVKCGGKATVQLSKNQSRDDLDGGGRDVVEDRCADGGDGSEPEMRSSGVAEHQGDL